MFANMRLLTYGLAIICLCLSIGQASADYDLQPGGALPLTNLYDNLLQREHAGAVVLPSHDLERKAQRSPSLRLRFGRSDPEMMNYLLEKRWFGDVRQKPIRSPSLRLRFGRRSDPSVPLRASYDDLLERVLTQRSGTPMDEATDDDYNDMPNDDAFERVLRKSLRLRYGRSSGVPMSTMDNEPAYYGKWRNMLAALRQNDYQPQATADAALSNDHVELDSDEAAGREENFDREARKPQQMRLRFGRSADLQMKTPAESSNNNDNKRSAELVVNAPEQSAN